MGVLRPCSGGRKRGPRVVSRETLVTRSLKRAGHERFFSWHRFGYDADLCASRSWPISLRIVPDGPSGRRDDFGAILSLRAKIGISLRVRRDCVTSNGEAGRRWRAEVACRGWRVGGGESDRQLWSTAATGSRRARAGDPSRSEPLDRIDTARDAESSCWRFVDGIRPCRRRIARRAHSRRAKVRRANGRRAAPLIARARLAPRTSPPQRGSTRRTEPDDGQPGWSSGRCRYSCRRLRSTQ